MNNKPTFNGRKKLTLCTPRKTTKPQTESHENNPPQKTQTKPFAGNKQDQLNWLYKQKELLNKQIEQIERRLVFGFSEPLKAHCNELKRKDMLLSCKISELLVDQINQARG